MNHIRAWMQFAIPTFVFSSHDDKAKLAWSNISTNRSLVVVEEMALVIIATIVLAVAFTRGRSQRFPTFDNL
jgi:hypothetical protein